MPDRHEHRVVTEAAVAARGPYKDAVDTPIEGLGLAVIGPGNGERTGEMRGRGRVGLGRLALAPDLVHRPRPVALAVLIFGPTRRENPGTAVERIDAQAAVV